MTPICFHTATDVALPSSSEYQVAEEQLDAIWSEDVIELDSSLDAPVRTISSAL
jgi:hypothetical protein